MVGNGAYDGEGTTPWVCHTLDPSGADRAGQIKDRILVDPPPDRQTPLEVLGTQGFRCGSR